MAPEMKSAMARSLTCINISCCRRCYFLRHGGARPCNGQDLLAWAARRHGALVPEPLAQVAQALALCHCRGVVLRDVKPDKILVEATAGCDGEEEEQDDAEAEVNSESTDAPRTRLADFVPVEQVGAVAEAVTESSEAPRLRLAVLGSAAWVCASGLGRAEDLVGTPPGAEYGAMEVVWSACVFALLLGGELPFGGGPLLRRIGLPGANRSVSVTGPGFDSGFGSCLDPSELELIEQICSKDRHLCSDPPTFKSLLSPTRVESKIHASTNHLYRFSAKSILLSPVSLFLYLRLSLQPLQLLCLRGPRWSVLPITGEIAVFLLGHVMDSSSLLDRLCAEILFKIPCSISALGLESLKVVYALVALRGAFRVFGFFLTNLLYPNA